MRDPGTNRARIRLDAMSARALALVLVVVLFVACSPTSVPTSGSTPTPPGLQGSLRTSATSSAAPSPPPPESTLHPLPGNVGGIPGPADISAELTPHTPRGELELGVARNFNLGHCGLGSPIDIDGSLWDPTGAHDGAGGPLTDDQVGELINATPTVVVLVDSNTMEIQTPHGAVVVLARHEGPRRYFLCD